MLIYLLIVIILSCHRRIISEVGRGDVAAERVEVFEKFGRKWSRVEGVGLLLDNTQGLRQVWPEDHVTFQEHVPRRIVHKHAKQ